jgi:hypothetical protein
MEFSPISYFIFHIWTTFYTGGVYNILFRGYDFDKNGLIASHILQQWRTQEFCSGGGEGFNKFS